ncbi:TspO/MBR family protein [Novosphingobium sp. B 225]|uniref:TspO/MBR family protein n=1 Tax=Novosphingobium sp. B 225 TaxID=1961849 RepID=UPI000B4B5A23|nr:TspO/MBR family protein [Novosphingobium sp. B 225]
MTELASPAQLRASLLRWSLFTVPGVLLLGFFSGAVAGSTAGNPWFLDLVKPSLYPPPATFGIVWSILYVLIGLALAMVITARGAAQRGLAIGLFVVQLLLNLAWSPLFFGAHQITGALVLLLVLDVAVLATVVVFNKVRPLAAALMLPYLGWVLFATVLNWQFLQANPDADGAQNSGAVSSVEFK